MNTQTPLLTEEQRLAMAERDEKFKQYLADNNIYEVNLGVALFVQHEKIECLESQVAALKKAIEG